MTTTKADGKPKASPDYRAKLETPTLEDYLAHQVAEKARSRVIAYFAVMGVAVSLVLYLWGWSKIESLLDSQFTAVLEKRRHTAEGTIDKLVVDSETQMRELTTNFRKRVAELEAEVETRSESFHKILSVKLSQLTTGVVTVSYDISDNIGSIQDQGDRPSVVGHILCYAAQGEVFRTTGQRVQLSPWSIYSPASPDDNGSTFERALAVMKDQGVYELEHWPDHESPRPSVGKRPRVKLLTWSSVSLEDPSVIVAQLSQRRPVVVSVELPLGMSLADVRLTPSRPGEVMGLHAVCLVGYDARRRLFRFANSWGADWGEQGFGYVGYDDLTKLAKKAIVISVELLNSEPESTPASTHTNPAS